VGAARGVAGVASLVADLTVYFASPVQQLRLPRSIAAIDLLITLARFAGSRMLARTLIERPSGGPLARGREGDRRRRGVTRGSRSCRNASARAS